MQPNAINSLLHSRKFLLAMLDALVASVALTLTWFLSPDKVASVLALIGIWQPVLIAVIIGIAHEDAANVKAAAEVYAADQKVVEAQIYDASAPIVPAIPCDEPTSTHTEQEDFDHFLAYSNLGNEPSEIINKLRLAFAANGVQHPEPKG